MESECQCSAAHKRGPDPCDHNSDCRWAARELARREMTSQPHSLPEGVERWWISRSKGSVLGPPRDQIDGPNVPTTALQVLAVSDLPKIEAACRSKVVGEVRPALERIAGLSSIDQAADGSGPVIVMRDEEMREIAQKALASLDSYTEREADDV